MASIKPKRTSKGERRYVVRYRDPNGKSREKWYKRRVDAEAFNHRIEDSKNRGEYLDPNAGRERFSVTAERWLATRLGKARSTQDRDRSYLNSMILPTFGDRAIKSITPSDIEIWLAELDRAPNTRNKALQIVRAILDLARRDHLIGANPAADVKSPEAKPLRPGRALCDEQMISVIAAAEEVDERTAILVHLAVRCGLRIGEALALRTKDVDLDKKRITVATSLSRREGIRPLKGRHSEDEARVINIPDDVVERLRRHLNMRSVTSIGGLLVTAPRGGPLPYDRWRSRIWVKIVDQLDFHVTAQDLRKTTITRLFTTDRWTPGEVQTFVGHSDPRMTLDVYTLIESQNLPQPSTVNTRSI